MSKSRCAEHREELTKSVLQCWHQSQLPFNILNSEILLSKSEWNPLTRCAISSRHCGSAWTRCRERAFRLGSFYAKKGRQSGKRSCGGMMFSVIDPDSPAQAMFWSTWIVYIHIANDIDWKIKNGELAVSVLCILYIDRYISIYRYIYIYITWCVGQAICIDIHIAYTSCNIA